MQFTFLGNRYQAHSSSIPVVEGPIGGQYRGQAWLRTHCQSVLIPQSGPRLQYRGVEYFAPVYSRGDLTSVGVAPELTDQQLDSPKVLQSIK